MEGKHLIRHVFVVNPTAGRRSALQEIREKLRPFEAGHDIEVHQTRGPGDATGYVRALCQGQTGPLRFYACGGDGTLNEVVNGARGFAHAAVGCYPCGSGNDFVKYYGGKPAFLDIEGQLAGHEEAVDLLQVNGRVAINMVHFGFDSLVAQTMHRVRRSPLIGGPNAYYTGVISAFFKPFANPCRVWVDDEPVNEGRLLLCTVACGQYVGGSFRCAPRSDNQDGLADVCLVNPISRLRFIGLIGAYTRGSHLDDPRLKDVLTYRRGRTLRVSSPRPFPVSMDGELIDLKDWRLTLLPGALRFVVPRGASPIIGRG